MHFGQENVDGKEIDIAYQLTYVHDHLLCDNTYTVQKSCSMREKPKTQLHNVALSSSDIENTPTLMWH